jgi:Na+/proline symporter
MQDETPKGGWRRYLPRLLLLVPFIAMISVPSYNRMEPSLGDIPFFYWYQLAWILIGALLVLVVYLIEGEIARRTWRHAARALGEGRVVNATATIIFVALFLLITWLGFIAARWRKADLNILHEWSLGGRRFGTIVTWFLLGGDLYTAYTFIAVPALVYGNGAIGFFAIPYAILLYPILYTVFPKFWAVTHAHDHVTAADFVRHRFDSRVLVLALATTGVIATMPYIALQLVGMEVVIGALGFPTEGLVGNLPLIIAFLVLAAFTYKSGLRAPALIAVVKDLLIFITVIAAVIVIPAKLGGYGAIFAKVPEQKLLLPQPTGSSLGPTAPISPWPSARRWRCSSILIP